MLKKAEVQKWLSDHINKPFTLDYLYMGDLQPKLGAWLPTTQEKEFSLQDWEPIRQLWDKEFKTEITGEHLWHGVRRYD